jgi:hypothetical protein
MTFSSYTIAHVNKSLDSFQMTISLAYESRESGKLKAQAKQSAE